MRAYVAILKDSFREALSSRVLWILLVLITLFLIALAGFSVAPAMRTGLNRQEVYDWPALVDRLREAKPDTPPGQIMSRLSGDMRKRVREYSQDEPGQRRLIEDLRKALVDQLDDRDLYETLDLPAEQLSEEAGKLVARGVDQLEDQELGRLNRLLFEAALPDDIRISPRDVVTLTYMGLVLSDDLTLEDKDLDELIKGILQAFIFLFVSVMGTMIAILVTAPIVPRMFEAGAIDLLLSKPVSRSLVFLSKFFGGCAFTLLNSGYLILGIWVIVGVRFEIWSDGLLLSIPVYLFLFVIYYSVSAFSGVMFRGAIMSVVMVFVFWALCFSVGFAKSTIEQLGLTGTRVQVITPAGPALLATNREGTTFAWDESDEDWEEVFEAEKKPTGFEAMAMRAAVGFPFVGPVYDAKNKRILVVNKPSLFPPGRNSGRLLVGSSADNWSRQGGAVIPLSPRSLFLSPANEILLAGPKGLFRFEGDASRKQQSFVVFGFDIGNRADGGRFVEAGEEGAGRWDTPFASTMEAKSGNIFVYSDGQLIRLVGNEQKKYAVSGEVDLETNDAAVLAAAGNRLLVALADGECRLLDATTLKTLETLSPLGKHTPRSAQSSAGGHYLALSNHQGELWVYDVKAGKALSGGPVGDDDLLAVAFADDKRLLVADLFMRVTEYSLPDLEKIREFDPPLSTLQSVYHYGVLPVYTVFPKPGELNNVISQLFTEEDAAPTNTERRDNLESDRIAIDTWTPFVSNLAFLIVILSITCLYVSRKDF